MSAIAEDPGAGREPQGNIQKVPPEVFYTQGDLRRFDRMGAIRPLKKKEIKALRSLEAAPGGEDLFPAWSEFRQSSHRFATAVEALCDFGHSDEERREYEKVFADATDKLPECFVLTLKDMQQYCVSQDEFLVFATNTIYDEVNARAEVLVALFDKPQAFPFIKYGKTMKRVSKYAAMTSSDSEIPAHIGDYYASLVAQDYNAVREFLKEVQRDQDIYDIKRQLGWICSILEELYGEGSWGEPNER